MSNGPSFRVFEHGPIERLEDNLYRVEGSLPGMQLRRVMTLVRLSDGRLVIHSAIAMEAQQMAALEAIGKPSLLLVPSGYHRLDAKGYKERYPDLSVLCPRGARERVAKVVAVDDDYSGFAPRQELRLMLMDGTAEQEGAMLVRSSERTTLVLNDVLFNMPHVHGLGGLVLRYLTRSSGGPTVSRVARMLIVKDKPRLRSHLLQLAETEGLCRIIVSHHQPIEDNPREVLRAVADTL